jgi:hypothetical protein
MLVQAIEALIGRWKQNTAPFEWTKHEVHQHSNSGHCLKKTTIFSVFILPLDDNSLKRSYVMKRRCSLQTGAVAQKLARLLVFLSFVCSAADVAFADGTGTLESFTGPLRNGLNLIMVFGFIAGCVMVMTGFLNAKRDESWKMTVIYGIGVAGAVALMKALFAMFGGTASNAVTGF